MLLARYACLSDKRGGTGIRHGHIEFGLVPWDALYMSPCTIISFLWSTISSKIYSALQNTKLMPLLFG